MSVEEDHDDVMSEEDITEFAMTKTKWWPDNRQLNLEQYLRAASTDVEEVKDNDISEDVLAFELANNNEAIHTGAS
ncbi:hypothetical protein MKX03_036016 [Papaver bracteatum]|nr:hypothetical protein MKX03_036016 [Papaver bracteatum]